MANLALCFLPPPWAESPGHDTTNPSRIAFLRGRKGILMFSSIIFNPLPYLFAEGNEKNKKGKEAERELKCCSLHFIGMAWLLASGLSKGRAFFLQSANLYDKIGGGFLGPECNKKTVSQINK